MVRDTSEETKITGGTTLLVHRLLAVFCTANLLPSVALRRQQLPTYATWWLVTLLPW